MRLKVNTMMLRAEASALGAVCSRSESVLGSILMEAYGEVLELTATDLAVTLRSKLPAVVDSDGSALIVSKALTSALGTSDDTDVDLRINADNSLSILGSSSKMRLLGRQPDDYPSVPVVTFDGATLSAPELSSALERVIPIAIGSKSSERLDAVQVNGLVDRVRIVATDGHRIIVLEYPASGAEALGSVTIASGGARALVNISSGALALTQGGDERQVWFTSDSGRTAYLRRPSAVVPEVDRVLEGGDDHHVIADVARLQSAFSRAALFGSGKDSMPVSMSIGNGSLVLAVSNDALGSLDDEVQVLSTESSSASAPAVVGNAGYMAGAVAAFKQYRQLKLSWTPNRRIVLEPVMDQVDGLTRKFVMAPIYG